MNTNFAFILGNGITRLEVDGKNLLNYGSVYGCNRIYQEFSPTVLVSTDQQMASEIQMSGYSKSNMHYTRRSHIIKNSGAKPIPLDIQDMSSGPVGIGLAGLTAVEYIFLIGFDLKGINHFINNIYSGTVHYKDKDSAPTPWGNWVTQIDLLIKKFPDKKIIQVNPLHTFTPDIWYKNKNFSTMILSEFEGKINN